MGKSKIPPSKDNIYISARIELLVWVRGNSIIKSDFARWYAGITKDPDGRRLAHNTEMPNGTPFWKAINVKKVKIALSLETSLHRLGFLESDDKGGYDKEKSKWIYVFKKYPTPLDQDTQD